jgi:NADP-dependent 3-hydroxy acid dehydrogenase YdfG
MGMLDNKVAIVTGATSGIGSGLLNCSLPKVPAVVFTGRRKVEGEAIAQRLKLYHLCHGRLGRAAPKFKHPF